MISLSNLSDQRMAQAKSGQWWTMDKQRALSNNSVVYTDKPDVGAWMQEWQNIYESKSGERGIYNRQAAIELAPERRDTDWDFGCNPCSEIVLRPRGLCNLSECVVRPTDKGPLLANKIRIAAILGTLQATLTDFRYLSKAWRNNAFEERLLGVSLTGIYDNPWLLNATPNQLEILKQVAVDTNVEFAKKLSIRPATAVTCIKPSGSVSQLVDSASGIHPRYGKNYWRRVRNDKKDPISDELIKAGVPYVTDPYNPEAWSFTFPKSAPEGAIVNAEITAIKHLEMWKKFALHWCEHKPSVTVSVAEDEWPEVGAWCWENFDILSGVSFLPKEDDSHTYVEAPYELCTKKDIKGYPKVKDVNWDAVKQSQEGHTEFACSSGACEI
jgi:ribonucleoside-diphosphate reductase alpha chain